MSFIMKLIISLKRATGIGYRRYKPFSRYVLEKRYIQRLEGKTKALCDDLVLLEQELREIHRSGEASSRGTHQ
jgi:hypothetical protein